MAFTLGQATDLTDKAIQNIWIKANKRELFYPKYYNVETGISDYYVKDSSISGLGLAGRILENAVVTAATPVQGYDKTYTQVQYGVLFSVTHMMWKFGIKKRNLENLVQQARRAVEDKIERLCADRLDNSFATSYNCEDISGEYLVTISGGDGVAMISNAHTREDGGSNWNNRVTDGTTVNMAWEYDALKAAHRTAALIPDPRGLKMNVNLDTFIFSKGYANHQRAVEMLGAMKRNYMPGSSDWDTAGVPDYKIIALPWVNTNTDYWWGFDSSLKSAQYGLQFKESQPISLEGPNVVFKTGEIQYKAVTIFDLGFNDARNFVGSKNTKSA